MTRTFHFVLTTCFAVLAIASGTVTATHTAAADEPAFSAAAYAMDITPQSFPIDSSGSMGPRKADAAHDPLHARCLVLSDGSTTIAFAVCDHCMVPREIFDAAKQRASAATGIPTSHILCSATHTHTGVTVAPTFQSSVETEYCDFLTERIADGIIKAHQQLKPAKIGWAVGHNPRQVFNRRWHMRTGFQLSDPFERGTDRVRMNPPAANVKLLKPAGPIDPEVPVVSIMSSDNQPVAVLANYSLHYVGGVPSGALSADYFGEFAVQLARLMEVPGDSGFVGIMSNGTSGDINNINFFEGAEGKPPFEQIRYVATDVAESAFKAVQRAEYADAVTLSVIEKEITLGVRKPTAAELAEARQLLAEAGPGPYRDRRLIYANETVDLAAYPDTVNVKLQAMRIGDMAIVTTPCETFVETGLAIKQLSPFKPTFTIELANGYNGYLPTAEQHALGGYETWRAKSSYLAIDAETKVRSTLLEMLNELATNQACTPLPPSP
jgi:hypothetical protein